LTPKPSDRKRSSGRRSRSLIGAGLSAFMPSVQSRF
jgi:hypothetical protein